MERKEKKMIKKPRKRMSNDPNKRRYEEWFHQWRYHFFLSNGRINSLKVDFTKSSVREIWLLEESNCWFWMYKFMKKHMDCWNIWIDWQVYHTKNVYLKKKKFIINKWRSILYIPHYSSFGNLSQFHCSVWKNIFIMSYSKLRVETLKPFRF